MSAREAAAAERGAMLSPGQRIAGKYLVDATLGKGATGMVYLARREHGEHGEGGGGDQRVALKVIHRHLCGDRQIYKRFHREAAILKRLEGEHLVRLLDFIEHDGLLIIALEYVEGRPLEELIQREAPLDPDRAVAISLQICAALESAHAAGVIHRDLKPANVLQQGGGGEGEATGEVTGKGAPADPPRIKVVDFGLAKVVQGEQMTTGLTEQDMIFGTPEYMAPEQVRGDEVDARSDVYALGCMLYEMVVGSVPFKKRSALAVMTAHLSEQVPPPRSIRTDGRVSAALDAVILRALAKKPEDRYESARAFAAALDACRPQAPFVAVPSALSATDLDLRRSALEHSPTIPSAPPSYDDGPDDAPLAAPPRPGQAPRRDSGFAATLPVASAPPGAKPPQARPVQVSIAKAPPRRLSDRALWTLIAVVFATLGILIGTLIGQQ